MEIDFKKILFIGLFVLAVIVFWGDLSSMALLAFAAGVFSQQLQIEKLKKKIEELNNKMKENGN